MRKIKCLLFAAILGIVLIGGCKKQESDAAKQSEADDLLIQNFISENNIPAIKDEYTGLYYHIIKPGSGNVTYYANTYVEVNYIGRFLNGQPFDNSSETVRFRLNEVIQGWTFGIPFIQPGGKIRLLIPSQLAYGSRGKGKVPPNTVLDFEIDLVGVVLTQQ